MPSPKPKILFLMAHPIEDASCRYRVHQFVPAFERAGYDCTVSGFSTPHLFRVLRFKGHLATKVLQTLFCGVRRALRLARLNSFDLVVIHREAFPFLTPLFERWVLIRHPKVVFSFDDAIYAGHDDVSVMNHPTLYRFKYGRGVDKVLRRSALVIAGNQVLADYARRFNEHVSVVPTVIDCEKFAYRPPTSDRKPLTIGWMGSRSTVSYLKPVEPALRRLAKTHPGRVRFCFFGCPDYRPDIPQTESLAFNLQTEINDLNSLDLGLMPMPDTVWTRGKCAFKAIQYMASGIPAVASPVGTTTDLIRHNQNGLLATTADEWYQTLDLLIRDFELRCRLAAAGRRTIEESYSLQVWGPRMVSMFDDLLPQRLAARRPLPNVARTRGIAAATRKAV
jgi:glycosyltransferase involved in cell wall biosynthesis